MFFTAIKTKIGGWESSLLVETNMSTLTEGQVDAGHETHGPQDNGKATLSSCVSSLKVKIKEMVLWIWGSGRWGS